MSKDKVTSFEDVCEKVPRAIFLDFLKYLVFKNIGYTKNVKPPGLTPVSTLGTIFFCAVRHMDEIVYSKKLEAFPVSCFFSKDSSLSYLDDNFKGVERIGGTFTFLESELGQKLNQFKNVKYTQEQNEMSALAKNLSMIFTFGVVQEISTFIRFNEKVYVNSRTYDDLTARGKQDYGYRFLEEMEAAARVLPQF